MSHPNDSTITGNGDSVSSPFPKYCDKVRNSDPSILPEVGKPLKMFSSLNEKENIELADALLENINITYLELRTATYTKSSAGAMAKYLRSSKSLQRVDLLISRMSYDEEWQLYEEMRLSC